MRKTTIYVPRELTTPPAPRLPLFRSNKPRLAERVDRALDGFGER